MLAPVATITAISRSKSHLGKTLTRLARHDLVAALGNPPQPWRAAIQRQANSIQNARLASTGRTRDGKDPVRNKSRISKIYLPFTHQRIKILKPQLHDLHACPPASSAIASLPCSESNTCR